MKKILCPTDFSDVAENAIEYAAKLAQDTNARLVLFNVQSLSDEPSEQVLANSNLTKGSVTASLEGISFQVSQAFKIPCHAEVQSSGASLAQTIAAKASGHDLIVMGTNGPDDIYEFFTGSNSYKASVKSSVPVLLIPDGCVYNKIKKIVYAFDYLRERRLPLEQLRPLIKMLKCQLSVLQVMEEAHSEEVEEELKELQFISQTLYAQGIQLKFDTIRSYEIAESIHSYVLRTHPDLLALCAIHKNLVERLFHNSLIKKISAISSYPVFVFHK